MQFDCHLHPDTAYALADLNVVPPPSSSPKAYQQYALILCPSSQNAKNTKTGAQDGSLLLAPNRERVFVEQLVAKVFRCCQRRGGGALWPLLNLPIFEKEVQDSGRRLKLEHLRLTSHLARHGGISTDVFEKVMELGDAKKCGRWRSAAAVRRYEKHARVIAVLNDFSLQQREAATKAAQQVGKKILLSKIL